MTIQQVLNARDIIIVEAYDKRTNRLAYSKHLSMDSPHFHVVGLNSPFRVRENSTLIVPVKVSTKMNHFDRTVVKFSDSFKDSSKSDDFVVMSRTSLRIVPLLIDVPFNQV